MRLLNLFKITLVTLALLGSTSLYAETSVEENVQRAKTTGQVLHETWYNSGNGQWVGTYKGPNDYWWHSANSLHALLMLMETSDYQASYQSPMETTYTKGNSIAPNFINHYNDDSLWWALTWLKADEVLGRVAPDHPKRADIKQIPVKIFDTLSSTEWDNTFGGGVWWSKTHGSSGYKNAITNGLFLVLAVKLAHDYPDEPKYLTWAEKSWTWYKNSGLINEDYLINDGLTSAGDNNGGITWTYNQGMAIGGLVGLYKLTNKTEYLNEAQKLADAAMENLADTNANVLQDMCEWKNSCVPNPNSGQFKGIFIRYFAELVEVTYDPELRAKYKKFVLDSADSAWENNRNSSNQFGHMWTGPLNFTDPMFQSSALDLFNAAVKVQRL